MTSASSSPRLGKRLRIFIGEADQWQGRPLYRVILERALQHGAMGVTVLHGIEGFGPAHHLSTDRLPDVSDNLPLIIDIVYSTESVERLLPVLDHLVRLGTMTVRTV